MSEVDQYLDNLPPDRREALKVIRALIQKTMPETAETMHYKMPTYEYGGQQLCAFASQKHYISLYMDTELVEKYQVQLSNLNTGKSCIRFKKLEQLPLETIKLMLQETMQKAKA